ncbi:hypothetical protein SK128_014588, partial [Halocaridina rubra]
EKRKNERRIKKRSKAEYKMMVSIPISRNGRLWKESKNKRERTRRVTQERKEINGSGGDAGFGLLFVSARYS